MRRCWIALCTNLDAWIYTIFNLANTDRALTTLNPTIIIWHTIVCREDSNPLSLTHSNLNNLADPAAEIQECCNLTINDSAFSCFQQDPHTFIMHHRVSCNPTWIKEQIRNNKDWYWFLFDELHHLFSFSEGTKKICTTAHIYNKDTLVSLSYILRPFIKISQTFHTCNEMVINSKMIIKINGQLVKHYQYIYDQRFLHVNLVTCSAIYLRSIYSKHSISKARSPEKAPIENRN